jgi:two-component system sensor histidine kinase KdpD
MTERAGAWGRLAAGLAAVGLVVVLGRALDLSNATTVSTAFLLVVLMVAAVSPFWIAASVSVAAMLCFNFFFLPPVGTFTIADPQNWVALLALLAVSLVASNLSATARARTAEAVGRRDELARLFDLSRDVLVMTESREAIPALARSIARRFDLDLVAIALPGDAAWDVVDGGAKRLMLAESDLSDAFAAAQARLEFDAYARTYAGHREAWSDGTAVRLVPLRSGTRPVGLLAAGGRPVEAGTLDALAGLAAIAIERAQFLEERKAGALTRRSEELKTALLASLSHDLRTPLTAVRVAAANLRSPQLAESDRLEQSDLILTEVERLTRLFENTLAMARLDAGAVAAEARWTRPSEIVHAAREQVEQTLGNRRVDLSVGDDVPVYVDPRLTARALAYVLENAAQYTTGDAAIDVSASLSDGELVLRVRDRGPGILPDDLLHLFERFYRGQASSGRTSGTGMGLWIARGLLAVEGGRIWAENDPEGGALFTLAVPSIEPPAGDAVGQ